MAKNQWGDFQYSPARRRLQIVGLCLLAVVAVAVAVLALVRVP